MAKKKAGKKKSTAKNKSGGQTKTAGPSDALPSVGSRVQWRSLPGIVTGTVTAILTASTTLNGRPIKASTADPRIKLRSDNGKICIHKPGSVTSAD